ncbi:MAG TPA: aminopeptidase [Clostridiales bacterium]|nr:aminopeptidase [Clostridiales bacterium]
MSEKSASEVLKEQLCYNPKNGRLRKDDEVLEKADSFCESYKSFLDNAKTERMAVKTAISLAEQKGFKPFDPHASYKPGDKIYLNNRNKAVIFAIIGNRPLEDGMRITAAHIDSPRLDLKPNPLYEDTELALFKTHYYGGIKKYQWTAIPLALHGVFVKKDGSVIDVSIGEEPDEPCFVVTDLLPHLATEQYKRQLHEGIKGEELNVLVGSHPFRDDKGSELVKLNILSILFEKYGVIEDDFLSAELECVPAFKARDVGLDRSMIGAYGHDDRVCAYPALQAILDTEQPDRTAVTILADKEEVGSEGNTGLFSSFFNYFVNDLAKTQDTDGYRVLSNSECLSADVNAALDPTFPDVMERRNAAMLNRGVVVTKYTGARGKAGTSDASAEFMGKIRALLDNAGIVWQIGELGKVDLGGGGTVAKFLAYHNIDVVDLGVPVLSMHSPFEVVAKFDVYMAYLAIHEFFK